MKPHTSETNPKGLEIELTLKFSAWGQAFMVPEGNMQLTTGGSQPDVLRSVTPMTHNNDLHCTTALSVQE